MRRGFMEPSESAAKRGSLMAKPDTAEHRGFRGILREIRCDIE